MVNERNHAGRKSIVIKKYENRRLYDTTNSRYINLDEVAQMVRDGYDVKVVDAATGEDLTRLILTQIIVEHAKDPGSAFPLDVLREMVVASGKATQESTLKYMRAMFDMYQNAFRAMTPPMTPFEFIPRPASPGAAPVTSMSPNPQSPQPDDDVDELRRRVQELEGIVSRLADRKRAGKSAPKRRR